MKKPISILVFVCVCITLFAQEEEKTWYDPGALRLDLILAGNHLQTNVFLHELYFEPYWSGSAHSMIDQLGFGSFRVEVFGMETGDLLFSNGFSTLFQEWQTTAEAKRTSRAFDQVVRIPFPREKVRVEIFERERDGSLARAAAFEVDPESIFIKRNHFIPFPVTQIVEGGAPSDCLDLTFVAEGYLPDQMERFRQDVRTMAEYIMEQEPFNQWKDRINVWAVESPSKEEGPSNPGRAFHNRTPAGTTYYSLGLDRYLTTSRHGKLMDAAANAPGDVICVFVNTSQYGGGGIYNAHVVGTSGHPLSKVVFIHELGHGLAGLGDEYFESDVAYEEFYPLDVEPWEANLTTLVDFDAKWGEMLESDTPVPTPAENRYLETVGVYEGGGYAAKGVYRPYIHCRMRSNNAPGFCPVCRETLSRVMRTYIPVGQ